MSKNQGKGFEDEIQTAFEAVPDCLAHRLKDQIGKYKNVSNPCDFYFYHKPYLYAIECKSTKGASLSFNDIREQEQIIDLHEIAQKRGVVAGFMIWFIDKDATFFVRHDVVYDRYMKAKNGDGKKSISFTDILELPPEDFHIVAGVKKRKYFTYNMTSFIVRKWK